MHSSSVHRFCKQICSCKIWSGLFLFHAWLSLVFRDVDFLSLYLISWNWVLLPLFWYVPMVRNPTGYCILFLQNLHLKTLYCTLLSRLSFYNVHCYKIFRLWFEHHVVFLSWVLFSEHALHIYCIQEQHIGLIWSEHLNDIHSIPFYILLYKPSINDCIRAALVISQVLIIWLLLSLVMKYWYL
jgi:hypothetical protein